MFASIFVVSKIYISIFVKTYRTVLLTFETGFPCFHSYTMNFEIYNSHSLLKQGKFNFLWVELSKSFLKKKIENFKVNFKLVF